MFNTCKEHFYGGPVGFFVAFFLGVFTLFRKKIIRVVSYKCLFNNTSQSRANV